MTFQVRGTVEDSGMKLCSLICLLLLGGLYSEELH